MTQGRHTSNLAARMGRWSAGHWKTATFGWLAFVVVAFAVSVEGGTKEVDANTAGLVGWGLMERMVEAGVQVRAGGRVLIQRRSVRRGRPACYPTVADVV